MISLHVYILIVTSKTQPTAYTMIFPVYLILSSSAHTHCIVENFMGQKFHKVYSLFSATNTTEVTVYSQLTHLMHICFDITYTLIFSLNVVHI